MRQTGFDARCKQLGVTKEQYYQVLKEKDEKRQQLRKELKQQRLALQDMKRQQKEKLKADYLDQQKQIGTHEGEEWRNIPDYSKYEVSSLGRFRNKKTGRIMARKVSDHTHGYAMVGMHRDSKGKQHTSLAHRIVALVFVPNPSSKSVVNHINHVRDDNRVSNLEWATMSENATASIHYYEHDISPDQ